MPEQPIAVIDWRANLPAELDLSPFGRSCLKRIPSPGGLDVLDIPSGFGRHSLYLAGQGSRVIAADIDQRRLDQSLVTWRGLRSPCGSLRTVLLDAEQPLLFPRDVFDLVLVIHYVSDRIIEAVHPLLRKGGFLVYETFGAFGGNWRDLPIRGRTFGRVPGFDILQLRERNVRKATGDQVTVKLLARKSGGS